MRGNKISKMINIVLPRADIITDIDYDYALHVLEKAGRTCYRSEPSGTHPSDFVKKLISRKHFSVLEHYCVSVKVVCDRGISHELVRHRIASYSQESTRYVNYNNVGIGFICPFHDEAYVDKWYEACEQVAKTYCKWIEEGVAPQIARSILPTCTATTMVMSANLRSWREIFEKRTSIAATGKPHPQMIEIMDPLLDQFYEAIPCVFEDLYRKKQLQSLLQRYWRVL